MNLIEQLVRDEGLQLHPYKDSVGKLTIGVGRNLDDVGVTRSEAMTLLANDVQNARDQIEQHLPWTGALDEVREAALVNMCFNLGIARLLNFKKFIADLQMALTTGDYRPAAAEMLASEWAEQVGPRARRLSLQIETGFWQ